MYYWFKDKKFKYNKLTILGVKHIKSTFNISKFMYCEKQQLFYLVLAKNSKKKDTCTHKNHHCTSENTKF